MLKKLPHVAVLLLMINACTGQKVDSENYPVDLETQRRERLGKLGGGDGIVLFGGDKKKKAYSSGIAAGASNPYLWRAALDSINFMPLQSVDSAGGVIITDWYQDPANPNDRLKINIMIAGTELRSDAVTVRTFKQSKNIKGEWQDIKVDTQVNTRLEDAILIRAREIKVKSEQN